MLFFIMPPKSYFNSRWTVHLTQSTELSLLWHVFQCPQVKSLWRHPLSTSGNCSHGVSYQTHVQCSRPVEWRWSHIASGNDKKTCFKWGWRLNIRYAQHCTYSDVEYWCDPWTHNRKSTYIQYESEAKLIYSDERKDKPECDTPTRAQCF